MGIVIVTTKAFKEKRIAEELRDYLYFKDSNVKVNFYDDFPGVLMISSSKLDSMGLMRIIKNSILAKVLNKIIPILYETEIKDLMCLGNEVIITFSNILKNCKNFVVRCFLRGSILSNSICEKVIGKIVHETLHLEVNCEKSDCLIIIEGIYKWCGIYAGSTKEIKIRGNYSL